MATVKIGYIREQLAHYGLHRQSLGRAEPMFIRRKVGEPTDYMHSNSRKVKRQREIFGQASKLYARLTPSQKGLTRHQFKEVDFIKPHGFSDTKILTGRQLFISSEIQSLARTGLPIALPMELCIMLCDPGLNPIDGQLWLSNLIIDTWYNIPGDDIATGNWLFSQVPPAQAAYKPFGVALGYVDPLLPEYQHMSPIEIQAYKYHILLPMIPFEYQWLWNTWGNFCQYWNAGAQLFIPEEGHHLQAIQVLLANWDERAKGPFTIKIETADADPEPGELLAQVYDHSDSLPTYPHPAWKQYILPTPIDVEAGQPLRLVVHTTPGWLAWRIDHWESAEHRAALRWAAYLNGEQYPRGFYEYGRNYQTETGQWWPGEGKDMAFTDLGMPL